MNKKILAAIDGSVHSLSCLDYLAHLFCNDQNFSVDLIGVVSCNSTYPAQQTDCKKRFSCYLEDAKKRLQRNGFAEEQVTTSLLASPSGIAAAIHQHLFLSHYDSLLIGRRGMGRIGELFLGSVSSELLNRCHEVPTWLVDGNVASTRFLLAVHSSPCSLLAADHLAFMLQGVPNVEIFLYHSFALFGSKPSASLENFHKQLGKDWCNKHLDFDTCLYQAHTQLLLENGITEEQITPILPRHDFEVSHDLLRHAEKHDCGTIVVGRRGACEAKNFFLGGVSDRMIRQAENLAIWIIG
jgi:nucleotide-binding universal stress UspA family protein